MIVRWLLRLLADDEDLRSIEADLAELHERRRVETGDREAGRWLRRQRRASAWHLLVDRFRRSEREGALVIHLWRDLRQSVRRLARVPALSATIVLTVGIGLGATAAMFGVVRAVLIDPLPYGDANALVYVSTDHPPYRFRLSVVDYRALEADHRAFSGVAAYQYARVTVAEGGDAERVDARSVTGSYFPLLRLHSYIGRVFDASDDARDGRIVVLTYPYWVRRFGADPSVLGRAMTIDGERATIVGVLQRVDGPLEHGVALYTVAHWPVPTRKGPFTTTVLARLRPDVTRAAALETLHAANARLFPLWRSSYQDEHATWGMRDLKTILVGDIRMPLLLVLAAVVCVLLIACANAVNLLVARGLHRRRELAILGALGASRGRLLQQTLVETGVLAGAAALLGAAIAAGALRLVAVVGGAYIPRVDEIAMSPAVVGMLAGLAGASALLIGLVPALQGARIRLDAELRAGGRSATDAPGTRRLRRVLVAVEFALATPLVIAAVLVAASLARLTHVPVGIDVDHLLTAAVSLPPARYPRPADRAAFWQRAVARLEALPGAEAAALADSRPPSESFNLNNFDLEDRPTPPGGNQPTSNWVDVSPGFFSAVQLRLEQGRLLDEHSLDDNVIVVDRAWARRFFPGERVVGRRLHSGGCTTCPWTTIVGVVDTVKWTGLGAPEDGTVYEPFVDWPSGFVVLRAAGDPSSLALSLREAIKALDRGLAVSDIATGDDLVADSLAAPRDVGLLIGMFAAAALALSVIGIYGVMAYFVQQHTREIGIRLALGGDPARVRRLVVIEGLRLVGAGVAFGLVAAIWSGRLIAALLFGITASDPRVLVGVPVVLLTAAFAACAIPASRAASLDPAAVLRE
ncbi:MAG TPA: ABC transporter permease [Vicinamibacterales bacterium]|nr:ABC transporter permease [Vicinamibacterales bacterium]